MNNQAPNPADQWDAHIDRLARSRFNDLPTTCFCCTERIDIEEGEVPTEIDGGLFCEACAKLAKFDADSDSFATLPDFQREVLLEALDCYLEELGSADRQEPEKIAEASAIYEALNIEDLNS